ncbi:hypothetical protein [Mycolicibacter minnesotensis]
MMSNLLTDRGVQASIATASTLAIVTVVAYQPLLLAMWGVWAVAMVFAVVRAVRS